MLETIVILILIFVIGFYSKPIFDTLCFLFKVHRAEKKQKRARQEAIKKLERYINCDHEV